MLGLEIDTPPGVGYHRKEGCHETEIRCHRHDLLGLFGPCGKERRQGEGAGRTDEADPGLTAINHSKLRH